jgi:hypothetical protein
MRRNVKISKNGLQIMATSHLLKVHIISSHICCVKPFFHFLATANGQIIIGHYVCDLSYHSCNTIPSIMLWYTASHHFTLRCKTQYNLLYKVMRYRYRFLLALYVYSLAERLFECKRLLCGGQCWCCAVYCTVSKWFKLWTNGLTINQIFELWSSRSRKTGVCSSGGN